MFKHYVGRTERDLMRAEDMAFERASAHDGAKAFHVVEAFREGDRLEGEIWVTDNEGLDALEADDRFERVTPMTTKGYEEN